MNKVKQFEGHNGPVKNQFILTDGAVTTFQSYDSTIAKIDRSKDLNEEVTLDRYKWNYSMTTSKYRNQFLNETTKETERKIKEGVYQLANLN